MSKFIQRIQSYFASPSQAQEKISDLLIEVRHRGIVFDVREDEENGQKFYYAQSVNYPRGYISASGATMKELEKELKDAVFTAFDIPSRFCNPDLIVFHPPMSQPASAHAEKQVHVTT
jgi:hypothetical protein